MVQIQRVGHKNGSNVDSQHKTWSKRGHPTQKMGAKSWQPTQKVGQNVDNQPKKWVKSGQPTQKVGRKVGSQPQKWVPSGYPLLVSSLLDDPFLGGLGNWVPIFLLGTHYPKNKSVFLTMLFSDNLISSGAKVWKRGFK